MYLKIESPQKKTAAILYTYLTQFIPNPDFCCMLFDVEWRGSGMKLIYILRWPHLQQKIEEEKRDKKRTQVGKERSSNNRTEYLKYEHTPKKDST